LRLKFGELNVAMGLMLFNALILTYNSFHYRYWSYYTFGVLSYALTYGLYKKNRTAVKITILYSGADLFLSLLLLISGLVQYGLNSLVDFLILHDSVSYAVETVRKEEASAKTDVITSSQLVDPSSSAEKVEKKG